MLLTSRAMLVVGPMLQCLLSQVHYIISSCVLVLMQVHVTPFNSPKAATFAGDAEKKGSTVQAFAACLVPTAIS